MTGARQVEGPDLSTLPCPVCAAVGTLVVVLRMVARPRGLWSLAGAWPKTIAVEVPHIVCTATGCGFVKAPSGS